MHLSDLFQLIFSSANVPHTGGSHFILQLHDASVALPFRGAGNNSLYPKASLEEKERHKQQMDLIQRYFTGTTRFPKGKAREWASRFEHESCLEYFERSLSADRCSDISALLRANDVAEVSARNVPEALKDLLLTGLQCASRGEPICDGEWNPSLIRAMEREYQTTTVERPKISHLRAEEIYLQGDVLYLGDYAVKIVKTVVPEQISTVEAVFTSQLCKVICEQLSIPAKLSELKARGGDDYEDFNLARRCFYLAESLRLTLLNNSLDGAEEFESIKQDLYTAVRPTYRTPYDSQYIRLVKTLEAAVSVPLTRSHITQTDGLFTSEERQGATHMLVNDRRLRWFDED